LASCLILGGYVLLRAFGLWWAVRSERPVTDQQILDLLEDGKLQMRVRTLVGVVVTDKVQTPALFGVIRPRLLLPQGLLETLGLDELHCVFLHELAHLRRRDIYLAWLVCLLQMLHWFNPLMWYAFRRMRADQEVAADSLALASAGTDESRHYGHTIVSLVERFSRPQYLPSLAGILENPSHIERRIQMIAKFKSDSHPRSALGIGVITVLGAISLIDPTRAAVSTSSTPQAETAMTIRLVERDAGGNVSPDGRYLCAWDAQERAITIREFATGARRTFKPTLDGTDGRINVWPFLMSPDNKAIAYAVWGAKDERLCLIGVDGSGQRVVCPNVKPVGWFPDGSRVLGVQLPGEPNNSGREIVSVSISDGSVQKIKYLKSTSGRQGAQGLGLSPDAKYLASDVRQDPSYKSDIVVVEIDSGQVIPVVQHPANDRLLGWTPDGRHILFASDRMGGPNVYLVPVAEGRVQGPPELVVRGIDIPSDSSNLFAPNGSYYYRVMPQVGTVYTAGIDLEAGRLLSAPTPLGAAGCNSCADWSPDGKRLAYCPGPLGSLGVSQRDLIRIRTLATGEERELIPKLAMMECLRWSRDGRSLLASGLWANRLDKERWEDRVYRVDVETGDSAILLQVTNDEDDKLLRAELSPDERTIFYSSRLYSRGLYALIRREMDNGEEKTIFEAKNVPIRSYPELPWALSPNGDYIAVAFNEPRASKIAIVPSQGGPAAELPRGDETPRQINELAWSADNKTVLFVGPARDKPKPGPKTAIEFWQATTDGSQPRKIFEADLGSECLSLRVHPNGRQIAFTTSLWCTELWVMENFLPASIGMKGSR
jgi:Tol biopolymer transport system component